jgi:hypothetical protein
MYQVQLDSKEDIKVPNITIFFEAPVPASEISQRIVELQVQQ